jgi:hypothetical protein
MPFWEFLVVDMADEPNYAPFILITLMGSREVAPYFFNRYRMFDQAWLRRKTKQQLLCVLSRRFHYMFQSLTRSSETK